MPGGSLSPAALGQGVSPTSIGQSFATGMVTGHPAAAGAHSLSEGAMTAMQSGSVPPPQATPPITTPPVVSAPTMAAGIEATHGPVDTPANTPGAPPASTGTTGPVAPTVVTAGPVAAPAAPVVGGSAVPAGPLPAYGSDLRPPSWQPPPCPRFLRRPYPARRWRPRRHRPHRRVGRWFLRWSAQPRKLWLDRLVRARRQWPAPRHCRPPPARRRARYRLGRLSSNAYSESWMPWRARSRESHGRPGCATTAPPPCWSPIWPAGGFRPTSGCPRT